MNNKTAVFDVQQEIVELKRRVAELERGQPSFWPTYQPPSVPGYPPQPPIFGPGNLDWWRIVSTAETPQELKDLFTSNGKETK